MPSPIKRWSAPAFLVAALWSVSLAAAEPPLLHRLADGEPEIAAEVARLLVPRSLEVRAVDERGLATPLSGVLELAAGVHRLRANPTTPPRDGIRFFKTNEVAFQFAVGGSYRLEGNADDLGWAPRVVPTDEPLPATREVASAVCWLGSVDGVVVAVEIRGLKVKRVTLQIDGEPSPRTWDYLAPALVRPAGIVRGFASGWSRDGALWGYDVGARKALKPGQRLRALYSECEPAILVEFQLPDGTR
jgi:hypothetical protein